MTDTERLMKFVDQTTTGCWVWTGAIHRVTGYGMFWLNGRQQLAHRCSHALLVGPIPDGYEIDHLCRVRACVKPEHLEAVTKQENMRRMRRLHCRNGHTYTDENTMWSHRNGRMARQCRECMRAAWRRYAARRVA